ncbi:hypothetical protein CC1G_14019 [Coprinopsis cinerea okayama7|uniref:Uncharacterized protein n=1 Tax=Coprinopsis cinerea (strain Okayama-7 / 130 / ATCC MYA-4618 / FGSC 9003) TaxID=240176 RepID=D6RL09_COPC7|nr:hypothetical protein CC1G_14019 [Coprinopsis cinerea okayama7\|eukprot:XP_002911981.1 hypothetical protein CC1G_14019 [Coprinopsis cinerea okayama7\
MAGVDGVHHRQLSVSNLRFKPFPRIGVEIQRAFSEVLLEVNRKHAYTAFRPVGR